ncbi:hypothetical protein [Streptomyces sp. NPDC048272]|uniref:hypothetical protein n=1 Tax=Streptomyces sp. NPDC048272 TaxID=3154616 RepID=UPI0034370C1D
MSHFPLISNLHIALRAVTLDTTPAALDQLDRALADLPLTDQITDSTEQAVRLALDITSEAGDHALFRAVQKFENQITLMLAEGPRTPIHNHPAMQALVQALSLCHAGGADWNTDSAIYRAWDRATKAGTYMIRAVSGFLYAEHDVTSREVTKQAQEFSTAARRAVGYHVREVARTALTVTAYDYGLFVIGTRTASARGGPHTWIRSIGSDTFRFEVTPPDMDGAPTGRLIVTSFKTGRRVHDLALSTGPERSRAVADALFLI